MPCGPFGTKPAIASAFIGILTPMDSEVLAGFAMPARASAFSSIINKIVLNADAFAGIAKPTRASASVSFSILMNAEAMSGFVPKGPQGKFLEISFQKLIFGNPLNIFRNIQHLWWSSLSDSRRRRNFKMLLWSQKALQKGKNLKPIRTCIFRLRFFKKKNSLTKTRLAPTLTPIELTSIPLS